MPTLPVRDAQWFVTLRKRFRSSFERLAIRLDITLPALWACSWTTGVLALADLVLKSIRIARYPDAFSLGVFQHLQLAASELGYGAGLIALGLAVMSLASAARAPRIGLFMVQVFCFLGLCAVIVVHGYFLETGETLDYMLVTFAAARPTETAPIIASAIRPSFAAAMIGLPLAMFVPSWWLMSRSMPSGVGALPRRAARNAVAMTSLSAVLFVGASQFRVAGIDPGFARAAALQLATGWWTAFRAADEPSADQHVPPRKRGPERLVRGTTDPRYNVVFIVLESARADATTAYVPGLATTPRLAELAKQGTLVEQAYTVVPHTSKALVAMFCGFEPRTSTALVESDPLGLPGRCLPRLLRDLGYSSVFFQTPWKGFEFYPALVRNIGFERFIAGEDLPHDEYEVVNYFGYEDAVLLRPNRQWLMKEAREPFIAAYLTNVSHHPYTTPSSWHKRAFSHQDVKNDYLNSISYVDSVVGKLIDQYKELGLFERTLFVVLGDHGEGFNEHGMWTHDNILYEEGVRIPMIIRAPALANEHRPARISGPVNQLALAPTVLDVLGLTADGGDYESSSIFARADQEPLHIACFRNAHCLASVREQHKFIYFYSARPPLLFDLQRDPLERHNLAAEYPARVRDWGRDLRTWESAVDQLHAQTSQRGIAQFVQRSRPRVLHHPSNVHFGEYVDLIGFSAESTRPDGAHVITNLYVKKPLPQGYHFALRLQSGFWYSRTLDEQPVRGLYPYSRWQAGDYIANLQRTDWPDSWRVMEICLELLDADDDTVAATSDSGEHYGCVPLTTLDHKTQREIVARH